MIFELLIVFVLGLCLGASIDEMIIKSKLQKCEVLKTLQSEIFKEVNTSEHEQDEKNIRCDAIRNCIEAIEKI